MISLVRIRVIVAEQIAPTIAAVGNSYVKPCRRFAAMLRDARGVAAVEFAIMAPMLASILIPVADLGYQAYVDMQVKTAVQAGARYALLHGWDSAGIQSAMTNATTWSGISASPAPAKICGCASGTTITATGCGSSCANGQTAGNYVTVSAQTEFQPLFPFLTVGVAGTLRAQATVRIQ